jgi:hypothetical protein
VEAVAEVVLPLLAADVVEAFEPAGRPAHAASNNIGRNRKRISYSPWRPECIRSPASGRPASAGHGGPE